MEAQLQKEFILGFGFFAISLCASLYDSFVPVFLHRFIDKAWLIGFLMTMDNYIGLILQPFVGALSDRTDTRLGRRMPYIVVCMPVAAVLVSLIPNHWSLPSLLVIIVVYNVIMAAFRSPTIALMPDITPPHLRSKANGVINLMGGLGAVIAYLVGSRLYTVNEAYPFTWPDCCCS
jgi:MFS family permease